MTMINCVSIKAPVADTTVTATYDPMFRCVELLIGSTQFSHATTEQQGLCVGKAEELINDLRSVLVNMYSLDEVHVDAVCDHSIMLAKDPVQFPTHDVVCSSTLTLAAVFNAKFEAITATVNGIDFDEAGAVVQRATRPMLLTLVDDLESTLVNQHKVDAIVAKTMCDACRRRVHNPH